VTIESDNASEAKDLEWLFIRSTRRNVKLGIFTEFHNRASKCPLVIDEDVTVTEYVLECVDIHIDGIILKNMLQRLKSGTGVLVILGGNIFGF